MIDSYSDIVIRPFDVTPQDIVLRPMSSPRNPMNYYPTTAETKLGILVGAGQYAFKEYEVGTLVSGGGSPAYRVIGSAIVRAYERLMNPVALEDSIFPVFGTTSPTTGAATNADSTPSVTITEDGVALGYSPTVTNIATGLYQVTINCTAANGFEAGKRYVVYVTATVAAIVGRDSLAEFEILALDLNSSLNATVGSRLSLNQFIGLG